MLKKIIICLLIIFCNSASFATDATDYLVKLYSKEYSKSVKLNAKREFCNPCQQKIGENFITKIVYGQADFKVKKSKKQKVSYICIFDDNDKPFWGFVIPR